MAQDSEIFGFTFLLVLPYYGQICIGLDSVRCISPVDSGLVTVQSFWPVLAVKIVWPLSPSSTEQYFVPLGWGGRRTWRHGGVSHPDQWGV